MTGESHQRSIVLELVQEQRLDKEVDVARPRKRGLTEEEIEGIHNAFIKTGGYVRETARHTGFGKSTVSRYARARGWYEELRPSSLGGTHPQSSASGEVDPKVSKSVEISSGSSIFGKPHPHIPASEKEGNEDLGAGMQADEGKRRTTAKLKKIRQLLFDEVMADENIEEHDESVLKITPRTLSEAVKALIDIDKRISEREGNQSDTMLEPYQRILERCVKIVKG